MEKNKPFYRLKNKNKEGDVVEYSTDFNFFLKNQIWICKSQNIQQVNSSLESKCFSAKRIINAIGIEQGKFAEEDLREIHQEILEGKYGEGECVN